MPFISGSTSAASSQLTVSLTHFPHALAATFADSTPDPMQPVTMGPSILPAEAVGSGYLMGYLVCESGRVRGVKASIMTQKSLGKI